MLLSQDLHGALRRFSDFLGCNLSEEAIDRIAHQCCFNNMRKNSMSNYSLVPQDIMDSSKSPFLRKGEDTASTKQMCSIARPLSL